jgi:hypothetical protein
LHTPHLLRWLAFGQVVMACGKTIVATDTLAGGKTNWARGYLGCRLTTSEAHTMTRRPAILVAASILSIGSMYSRAEEANSIADVRCIVAGVQLSTDGDPTKRLAGTMLTLYYLGKFDGSNPHLNLDDALAKVAAKMTESDFLVEAERCGKGLAAKAQQLTRLGKEILHSDVHAGQ